MTDNDTSIVCYILR